jgi:hypothetical protein
VTDLLTGGRRRRLAGSGRQGGILEAEGPADGIAQELLGHRVEEGLAGVAVGEVTEPAPARLADPAGGGHPAVIGAVPQQEVDMPLVAGRSMLFVGHEEPAAGPRRLLRASFSR